MKLKTRTLEIAGITSEPDGAWMTQLARNLTDSSDGFLSGAQYVILDRDPLYTAAFRRLLRDSGVKPVVLPAWSPNLNAYAERCAYHQRSLLESDDLRRRTIGTTSDYRVRHALPL
jgi:hypothetical protein